MGNPVVRGGRYVDPLPAVVIPLTSGGRRNVQPNRTLVVSFGVGGILLRGHVDLYGPIRDNNVPDSQQHIVHARGDASRPAREIIRILSGQMATDRPTAAVFRRAASQFPTGFYEMTVTITAPNSLKPPTADGGVAGDLVYSRVVWVQFDIVEQSRALPGEEGAPAATPDSARPQDIGLIHKGVVIGDPVTLELAYLFQFGREFPGIVSAVNYRLPTSGQLSRGGRAGTIGFPASGGGGGFGQQFALYHGTVKKIHGNIGLARNIYRMVQELRDGVRARRLARSVPDPEQMLPPPSPGTRPSVDHRFSQAWLDEFVTMANASPNDIRMAMNHVMYEELFESASQDRELLTRLFPDGQPPSRLGQGVQALEYMGKVIDVFDMGINAINYGEHCRRSLAARNALLGALRAMYHDKAFSLLRLMEIENFRHTWVRRGAQAIEMLRSVPTALLGWIPVGGWVIAIAGFLAGQMENLTRGAVVDWLEDNFNGWMVDPNFQRQLDTQTYQMAFGGSDETHTAQRMLIQLTIRSKLLYDLKELVDSIDPDGPGGGYRTLLHIPNDERIRMARSLVSRILTRDPWYIHRNLVFSDRETYTNPDGIRDIMGTPQRDWIPVEYQDFFPIDCYGGDVREFARRFREGHDLKLEVEIQGADLDRFEIRFGHFHELGFVNRVWAFVYAIRPPTAAQMGEDFVGREQDTRQRPNRVWSDDLRNTLRQISEDLEQSGTFEANLRPHALWVYRREEGESEQGPDGPVPHLTRDGDDFVALCYPRPSGITNHFDFSRHAYLFLLLTNIRDQIVFSKMQYYVGGSRTIYPMGASRYDVQGSFLVRENQRIRFQ